MQDSKYFEFSLKAQQERAFCLLIEFVNDSKNKVFILNGYAGTGKTTLMSGLIKYLNEREIQYSLLATTGRAAKILSNKTKVTANTIHSHFYVFNELSDDLEKMSSNQDNPTVDEKGQICLKFGLRTYNSTEEKIYIIDESSMISDTIDKSSKFAEFGSGRLLHDILHYDKNGKFLFVGDPCQLPPIKKEHNTSPALSKEYIESEYGFEVSSIELTDIVRQKDTSGIIVASNRIRALHAKNPSVKWAKLPLKGNNNIYFHLSHVILLNQYIQKLRNEGFSHSTMICQTNRHCTELNKLIRNSLYGNINKLVVGDLLMVTQNNYVAALVNGDQVIVKKIGAQENKCGLSFIQVEVEELFSKKTYELLLLEDILYSIGTNLNPKQHKDLMIDFFRRMQKKGIKQKDKMFKENMLKDAYLNALKAVFGYAITCHKSQGGEWDEVFLYLDNKIHGLGKPEIYQWWYTAVTRAKNNLHIVDDWFIN
jgi:ATP-dependent exoDNAse (exonuclease V) alpha subunit